MGLIGAAPWVRLWLHGLLRLVPVLGNPGRAADMGGGDSALMGQRERGFKLMRAALGCEGKLDGVGIALGRVELVGCGGARHGRRAGLAQEAKAREQHRRRQQGARKMGQGAKLYDRGLGI